MEKLVPHLYKTFGLYKNTEQMFPKESDGLLPVQRRLLLAVHSVAKSHFIKTAKVLGECMGRWHPHAEASGPIETLVHNGFILGGGSWGGKIGTEASRAAAPRYTKVKANPFIEELAFRFVDCVPWEADELDPEPIYLPTMIPFCLMSRYEINTIGFGFRTQIPCYKIEDLIDRLLFLVGKDKKKPTIKPYVEGCDILSNDDDCEIILTEGKGKIEVCGKYKISEKDKCIFVYGWSPRMTFENLLDRIDNFPIKGKKSQLLSNGDIGYIDQTHKNYGTKVKFEIAKQRNTDEIFKKMCLVIPEVIKTNLSYEIIVVNDNKEMIFSSVDKLLLTNFENHLKALNIYFDKTIKEIDDKINELSIIAAIRPFISEAISKYDKDKEKIIKYLSINSQKTIEEINNIVAKYRITTLFTVSTDTHELDNKKKDLVKQKGDSRNVCINRYLNCKNSLKEVQ